MRHVKFRDGDRVLTLWVEKESPDGYLIGWCPELQNNIIVHPENVVEEVAA